MKSTDPNFIQAQKDGEKWMKEHPDVPVVDVDTGERKLAKDWIKPAINLKHLAQSVADIVRRSGDSISGAAVNKLVEQKLKRTLFPSPSREAHGKRK